MFAPKIVSDFAIDKKAKLVKFEVLETQN